MKINLIKKLYTGKIPGVIDDIIKFDSRIIYIGPSVSPLPTFYSSVYEFIGTAYRVSDVDGKDCEILNED